MYLPRLPLRESPALAVEVLRSCVAALYGRKRDFGIKYIRVSTDATLTFARDPFAGY